MSVHALVDVLAADVGGKSLLVVGDVGAVAGGGANARVGEGVLDGLLACAFCDDHWRGVDHVRGRSCCR